MIEERFDGKERECEEKETKRYCSGRVRKEKVEAGREYSVGRKEGKRKKNDKLVRRD